MERIIEETKLEGNKIEIRILCELDYHQAIMSPCFYSYYKQLKKDLDQQRFNNKHNLSIDQKVSDKIQSLERELEAWKITARSNLAMAGQAAILADKNRCLELKLSEALEGDSWYQAGESRKYELNKEGE